MKQRIPGRVSLDRALSKLGLASRTQAKGLIESGQVRVNGTVRTDAAFQVRPETATIEISGEKKIAPAFQAFVLNKPKGVITSRADEKNRPTVFSLISADDLAAAGNLMAAGRLDYNTTGLLILTNDSRLASWLTDPATQIPRTYLANVRGEITGEKAARVLSGILDDGETLRADSLVVRKSSARESEILITLLQGKNREIRRLLLAIGNEVIRLKRIAYGPLELGELGVSAYRRLSRSEITRAFPAAPIHLEG